MTTAAIIVIIIIITTANHLTMMEAMAAMMATPTVAQVVSGLPTTVPLAGLSPDRGGGE
jgi:hypothetical protein